MADEKVLSPPYISFSSLQSFLANLRDHPLPDRIDRSVFGKMSGGLAYGLLSALKFLRLIDANGRPDTLLANIVDAEGDQQKAVLRAILERSYPGLFDGTVKLDRATSSQLDEHFRTQFGIAGSTIDKAATFFLAAAAAADVPVSAQLKGRKPIGAGNGGKKSRPKKVVQKDDPDGSSVAAGPVRAAAPIEGRDPVQVLVDIIDMSAMDDEEQQAVWTLIRFLKRQESKKKVMEDTE